MDKPIDVGDLVVVVRPGCCDGTQFLGLTFRVVRLESDRVRCGKCRKALGRLTLALTGKASNPRHVPVVLLKRIPPPEELGIVDEREELKSLQPE